MNVCRAKVLSAVGLFGLAPSVVQATVFTDVPEAAGFRLVYDLAIPSTGPAFNSNAIPYSVNNATTVANGSYSRIGYYLELAGSANATRPNGFVYVSFDAADFFRDATKIGVPSNGPNGSKVVFNGAVTNMNVVSNVPGITTGTGLSGGKLEFWPSNYAQGANGVFDHDDNGFNATSGHGSMQIHNTAVPQTLIGYSDWGGNNIGQPSEIGIGNNTGTGSPDWTFSDSGTTYTVRNMQIVVDNTPVAAPTAPPAPANVLALSPGLAGYQLVYQEALSATTASNPTIAYDIDNTALVPNGSFQRVAYVLELAGATSGDPNGFVAVSFDAQGFATSANKLGIPTVGSGEFYQQFVKNMIVDSNVAGVAEGLFAQGNVEFWPSNYNQSNPLGVPGASTTGTPGFDFGDGGANTGVGFGSMQVHNFLSAQTVFAYNSWGDGGTGNIGIGNNPFAVSANQGLDWTFRDNAGNYTVRNLYVLIQPNATSSIPEPASLSLIGLAAAAMGMRRRRHA